MSDLQEDEDRAESPVSSCVSMKSDRSRRRPPDFSREPGPSHSEEKRSHVSEEKLPSCCASCQDVLKDPVSTSCGHWLCRRCITSYWDQSGSPGESSCPQCGQRSRTGPGAQTAGDGGRSCHPGESEEDGQRTSCVLTISGSSCDLEAELHPAATDGGIGRGGDECRRSSAPPAEYTLSYLIVVFSTFGY
ncbi:Hypothetical protein SMAX5B_009682 [Scophthalmus maximus]|uniref:RING-type domain-containing protein n=1 Tax=Scophthalmus maximus TaxID=52904 RepID=A0A2U9CZ40_SCOMX|nr:Hypothetical protein SMAX5B_009682 [Scophthalmus maximus]